MVTVPIAVLAFILVPTMSRSTTAKASGLDIIGVNLFISALILFIFALTSGATDGWSSATVLTTLILSIVLIGAFLIYESHIDPARAALPPKIWFFPKFAVLVGVALAPYYFGGCWSFSSTRRSGKRSTCGARL
jgi:heme/copper-type cytochrome/quinol oxidase subunit 4